MMPKLAFNAALYLSFYVSHVVGTSTTECHEAYSCQHGTISQSEFNSSSIQCYGYHSCSESHLIETLTDSDIECLGSYACYQSTTVQHTYNSDNILSFGDIICCGLYSCSEIDTLYNVNGSIACDGELSCFGSNIEVSDGKLFCIGDRACANGVIRSSSASVNEVKHYMSGHLSAQNSKFYSNGDGSSVYYSFDGVGSGDGAEVICGKNDTCTVVCHSNACNNLTLTSVDGGTFITKCYSEKNDICPGGVELDDDVAELYKLPSLKDVAMSSYDNSVQTCENEDSSSHCDSYQECLNIGALDTSICCSAFQSCNSDTVGSDGSGSDNEIAIRCDGTMACANLQNFSSITSDGGDVYFTSYSSASGTQIVSNGGNSGSSSSYDVYCTGMESCVETIVMNADNLYCNGGWSCNSAILIENVNNIWAYGDHSAAKSVINDVTESVYCGTQYGCSKTVISNVGNDVFGHGYNALYQSSVSNVGGSVVAFGVKAALEAEISNATKLYCKGTLACRGVTLRNIETIEANGKNILYESVIISERTVNGAENGVMSVSVNGTIDKRYDLYCNASDTCNVECRSQEACKLLYIHCFGTCNVDCDDTSGYHCPIYVTDEPSNMPTEMPTIPAVTEGSSDGNNGENSETDGTDEIDNTVASVETTEVSEEETGGGAVDATEVAPTVGVPEVSGTVGESANEIDLESTLVDTMPEPVPVGTDEEKGYDCNHWLWAGAIIGIVSIVGVAACCASQYCSDDAVQKNNLMRVTSNETIMVGVTHTNGETNETNDKEREESSESSDKRKNTERMNGES